jgi:hypothetical protein
MSARTLTPIAIGRLGIPILAGAFIGGASALLLTFGEPIWIVLLLVAMLGLIPPLVVKDAFRYWLCIFLLALPLDITKMFGTQETAFARLESIGAPWGGLTPSLGVHLIDLVLLPLLVAWLLGKIRRREKIYFPRIHLLPLAFLGYVTATTLVAPSTYYAVLKLIQFWKFFAIYVVAADAIDLRKHGRAILVILLLTMSLQAMLTTLRYSAQDIAPVFGGAFGETSKEAYIGIPRESQGVSDTESGSALRGRGTFGSPNATAMHLELLLPFALSLLLVRPSGRVHWGIAAIMVLGLIGHTLTFSRAGLFSLIASAAVCLAVAAYRQGVPRRILGPFLGVGTLAVIASVPLLFAVVGLRGEFLEIHLDHLRQGVHVALSHPVFGVGLNNSSFVRPLVLPEGLAVSENLVPMHSSYLIGLAETGVFGFAMYVGFFVLAALRAFRLSGARNPMARVFALAILGAFTAVSLHNVTDVAGPQPLQASWWLYAGIIVAVGRPGDRKDSVSG